MQEEKCAAPTGRSLGLRYRDCAFFTRGSKRHTASIYPLVRVSPSVVFVYDVFFVMLNNLVEQRGADGLVAT